MTPDQLEVSAAIWRKSFSSPCVHMYSYIYISVNTHSVYSFKYFNSYSMFFNHMFSKPPAAPFIKIIFHFKGIVCRNKVFKNKVLSPRQVCLHSKYMSKKLNLEIKDSRYCIVDPFDLKSKNLLVCPFIPLSSPPIALRG